ncbi:MAG TPA: hypothetical protein VF502_11340 [Stellaceae bacterium]
MAEQKRDKGESVLTDKEKFEQDPDKEKVSHMGDKPGRAREHEQQTPQK